MLFVGIENRMFSRRIGLARRLLRRLRKPSSRGRCDALLFELRYKIGFYSGRSRKIADVFDHGLRTGLGGHSLRMASAGAALDNHLRRTHRKRVASPCRRRQIDRQQCAFSARVRQRQVHDRIIRTFCLHRQRFELLSGSDDQHRLIRDRLIRPIPFLFWMSYLHPVNRWFRNFTGIERVEIGDADRRISFGALLNVPAAITVHADFTEQFENGTNA
jgi:hypothetical protein